MAMMPSPLLPQIGGENFGNLQGTFKKGEVGGKTCVTPQELEEQKERVFVRLETGFLLPSNIENGKFYFGFLPVLRKNGPNQGKYEITFAEGSHRVFGATGGKIYTPVVGKATLLVTGSPECALQLGSAPEMPIIADRRPMAPSFAARFFARDRLPLFSLGGSDQEPQTPTSDKLAITVIAARDGDSQPNPASTPVRVTIYGLAEGSGRRIELETMLTDDTQTVRLDLKKHCPQNQNSNPNPNQKQESKHCEFIASLSGPGYERAEIPFRDDILDRPGGLNVPLYRKNSKRNGRDDPSGTELGIRFLDIGRISVLEPAEIAVLPVSGNRTADALALLAPGVVTPPMAGTGTGPSISPGVGSGGEVVVNGMRPRLNNFTVDGADNNDEEVGIRRQGFVFSAPYTIESIREFQIRTALYDARFGRGSAGQLDVLTNFGRRGIHASLYGYAGASTFDARDYFNRATVSGTPYNLLTLGDNGFSGPQLVTPRFTGSARDSFTSVSTGYVAEGELSAKTFLSMGIEWRQIRQSKTYHFAVPTIPERGVGGTGTAVECCQSPSSLAGNAIFSLFPFPNNPAGPYGANTFTRQLPANGQGALYTAKLDREFFAGGRTHQLSASVSGTAESSQLPVTGGALYSSLSPNVHTYTGSIFLDTHLGPSSANSFHFSFGQALFTFGRVQDPLLTPSRYNNGDPFLLNGTLQIGGGSGVPNGTAGFATVSQTGWETRPLQTEHVTGPVGHIEVAGYSGLGADVFRFPQNRRDKTLQVADSLSRTVEWGCLGKWGVTAGIEFWRLNFKSTVNPNSRPYLQFNGQIGAETPGTAGIEGVPLASNHLLQPSDMVALGFPARDEWTQTANPGANLDLFRNQLDFFVNADHRIGSSLFVSFTARVELNHLPKSTDGRFEKAFKQADFNSQINTAMNGCQSSAGGSYPPVCAIFLNGLNSAFAGQFNDVFASNPLTVDPRIGLSWNPGADAETTVRAGFGKYTSQFPAVILSESQSIFPQSLALNNIGRPFPLSIGGIFSSFITSGIPLAAPVLGNLLNNTLPSGFQSDPIAYLVNVRSSEDLISQHPSAHVRDTYALHYGVAIERHVSDRFSLSLAYVGTNSRHLLRQLVTGPLGRVYTQPLFSPGIDGIGPLYTPAFLALPPNRNLCAAPFGPPLRLVPCGGVTSVLEETGANSLYNSLQSEMRVLIARRLQGGLAFTYGHSIDDASDFFETRSNLPMPQDSSKAYLDRASSDFDARYRMVAHFSWTPIESSHSRYLGGWSLAGIYTVQSGMPFTVNTVYDLNQDGTLNDRLATANGLITGSATGDSRIAVRLPSSHSLTDYIPDPSTCDPSNHTCDGAVGRNTFRAMGINNLDLSVARSFQLSDALTLKLRIEAFNAMNHPQFGIPVRYLGAPGFGTSVDTAVGNRKLQLNLQLSF